MKLGDYLKKTGESQASLGGRIGLSQSRVSQLVNGGGERLEAEKVLGAAAATDWNVTPHDWRPDLYPHPDDGMPKPLPIPGLDAEKIAA